MTHTDLKPPNVLFTPNDSAAKLIDFSTATDHFRQGRHFGTREYRAPEVLLGGNWDTGVDVWSAACTIYEIATGEVLFNAHRKAREVRGWLWRKAQWQYDAFRQARAAARESPSQSALSMTSSTDSHASSRTSVSDSGMVEVGSKAPTKATPFFRRNVIDGRYILVSELGSGHFSTVWKAVRIPEHLHISNDPEDRQATPKPSTHPPERADHELTNSAPAKETKRSSSSSPDCPYRWARLYDRCVNFAHFLSIQETLGHYPIKLARQGHYFRAFYTRRKRLKFNPRLKVRSIEERLIEDHAFSSKEAESFASFLAPMLAYNPKDRADIAACLEHPWLRS